MAKLPSRYDISQPISGRSGRAIASFDTSGLGRGIESLGASLADIGAQFKKDEVATDLVGADGQATKELHDLERTFDADGDYGTFGQRAEQGANAIRDKYAQRIRDPRARQAWVADFGKSAEASRNRIADLGERRVREGRLVEAKTGLQGYQALIADNTMAEADRGKARATAEASIATLQQEGLLSPSEADKWREDVITGGDFLYGQRQIESQGSAALGGGDIVSKIIGVESGGNPNAKNPNSSATGLGQFIASTWMQTVKEHRPDLLEGRTTKEVLDLRKNGDLSREMTGYLVEDNAKFLRNQGVVPTNGDLYLAHFLGPRGASQIMKADPGASVASVVGQDVVSANSFLKGMNAADVRAWAEKKMGGAGRPEWYTSQPADKQLQLEKIAAARDSEVATAEAAQRKAVSTQANDDYRLRIAVSDPTLTQQQILSDSRLDTGQQATLLNSYNQANEANAGAEALLGAIASGQTVSINAFDAEQAKVAEKAYGRMVSSLGEDQRQAGTESFIRSTGYIPKAVEAEVRAGASSTDPQVVAGAMQQASALSRLTPSNFASMPGSDVIGKKLDLYKTYTDTMGLTPAEAGAKIVAADDPEQIRKRDAILKSEPVKKLLKELDASDVAAIFDKGAFSSAPDVEGIATPEEIRVGVNPQSEAAIVADYRRIMEDALFDANGDQAAAQDIAKRRFSNVYGTTDLSPLSSNIVVRYPPEKAYAALPDGSHEYIRTQLVEALKGEGIEADGYFLQGDTETEDDIRAGRPARYQVYYEKDGKFERFNVPFYADRDIAMAEYQAKDDIRVKDAERRMLENRVEEDRTFPEGRGLRRLERFGNDQLYRGIARENSPLGRALERARQQQERVDTWRAQEEEKRRAFDALSPEDQRQRALDEYLDGTRQ